MTATTLREVPQIDTFPPRIATMEQEEQDEQSKIYRGPRCGYCHGRMGVETTGHWDEQEQKLTRYRKCLRCGLSDVFTERRGK